MTGSSLLPIIHITQDPDWNLFESIPCRNVHGYRLFFLFVAILLMA
jgi:hypothetical protein